MSGFAGKREWWCKKNDPRVLPQVSRWLHYNCHLFLRTWLVSSPVRCGSVVGVSCWVAVGLFVECCTVGDKCSWCNCCIIVKSPICSWSSMLCSNTGVVTIWWDAGGSDVFLCQALLTLVFSCACRVVDRDWFFLICRLLLHRVCTFVTASTQAAFMFLVWHMLSTLQLNLFLVVGAIGVVVCERFGFGWCAGNALDHMWQLNHFHAVALYYWGVVEAEDHPPDQRR